MAQNSPKAPQDARKSAPPAEEPVSALPASLEAEQGLLGAILLDNGGDALRAATEAGVTAESFLDGRNRLVWDAIAQLTGKGFPIDGLSVTHHLRDSGRGDAVGAAHVEALMDATPTRAHAAYYAAVVRDKEKRREIIKAAQRIMKGAATGDDAWDILCSKAELEFSGIAKSKREGERRPFADIVDAVVTGWKRNADGTSPLGLQTGIPWLDEATGGILKGSYWVISGRPGSCKSTICRMIAESVAARGTRVSIKTTEQTEEQYTGSMVAAQARQSVLQLNRPFFPKERFRFIDEAAAVVRDWPIDIDERMDTRSGLRAWYLDAESNGSELMILDYLQDVKPETREEERSAEQKLSLATQTLRECAKNSGSKAPVIVVSTESNEGNLRYSGQTEYDAVLWGRMSKAEDFEAMRNPKYIFEFRKSRFAPAGQKVALYYLYGKLLEKEEYEARLALMAAMTSPDPVTGQPDPDDREDAGLPF